MEWEWENHEIFTSKVITASPKKLQSSNWEDGINESFNLSASDVVNNSSTKSSISASAESSFKENMTMSKLSFGEFIGGEVNGKSPLLETSVSSGEPFISLKLGKRTYFENNFGRSDCKMSSFSNIPMLPISSTGKKAKSSFQSTLVPRCQVEGCDIDLSSAKEYHRKHRVCESHSKCPRVVVSGLERRFCQQCSRFHSLGEFDEKKRSCRRRLSDHNARRRKPQQETIQFNSTNQSSSFYGFKDSSSPNVDALRALSLLSNNSWGLYEPDLTGLDQRQSMHSDIPPMHQGLPLSTPDYWQTEQQDIHAKTSNPANSQFQEFPL